MVVAVETARRYKDQGIISVAVNPGLSAAFSLAHPLIDHMFREHTYGAWSQIKLYDAYKRALSRFCENISSDLLPVSNLRIFSHVGGLNTVVGWHLPGGSGS